ncbi:MAG: endonuclease [Phycisphaerales bacterium]|nr:endonuclease [Phycisphaerales bacterium]
MTPTRHPSPAVSLRTLVILLAGAISTAPAAAQPSSTYYNTVDATSAANLRTTLHDVIDDHTRYPYTSSATDTWDILDAADEDPNDTDNVLDLYRNASYPKAGGGNDYYNREHSWPKSYGFPNDGSGNYPYTDCHHLFVCDDGYNSSRNNKPYQDCDSNCLEKTTEYNNGQGGGSGTYPGNSDWTDGSGDSGRWQTWIGRQGDVARALFYMDVRYEGGTHGITSAAEPDLVLTDNMALVVPDADNNQSVAYMGKLSDLLAWHHADPVDGLELHRTNVVESYQGNRNPFIDHPEWADCLFSGHCAVPWINEFHYDNDGADVGEFVEIAGVNGTNLSGWKVIGYNGADGSAYKTINLSGSIPDEEDCMGALAFTATGLQNGPDALALVDPSDNVVQFISYEGAFTATDGPAAGRTAVDIGVSESPSTSVGYSLQCAGTGDAYNHFTWAAPAAETDGGSNSAQTLKGHCGASVTYADPWINELHYDNSGADVGEFVEVAGPAGLPLSNWTLVAYNGANGEAYDTVALSGTISDQSNGFGTLAFAISGLQNGAPDGVALVDPAGDVIQFLSYEGNFTATDGPADGHTSVDIGVSEDGSTSTGYSLRLAGTNGCAYADFTWQSPAADTDGALNTGQTFSSSCP